MKLTFENEIGKVVLGSDESFKIIGINGLYTPTKNYGTINFANYDGQLTYSSCATARIITILGDIVSKNIREELEQAMCVFNEGGTLVLDFGDKKRKITCNQVSFSVSDRTMYSAVFTLQLVCDYPYFTDEHPTDILIFGEKNMIENPITLPCVLSIKGESQDIVVNGHTKTYPEFIINVKSKGTESGDDVYGYKIENKSTNQIIYLKYKSVAGEKIYIDVSTRQISSSINGSIVHCLEDYNQLENFYLDKGINTVVATDLRPDDNALINVIFDNYYVEAVY